MRNKLTIILFGLLLAVGWTNVAQAQALPEKAFTRYSVKPIESVDGKVPLHIVSNHRELIAEEPQLPGGKVKKAKAPSLAPMDKPTAASRNDKSVGNASKSNAGVSTANGESTMMKAPLRDGEEDMKSLTKAEADALTYNWVNPKTGAYGNDVPSTQVAKDPYQIYELLKFVYTNPAFPGPYTNAYTDGFVKEDPVYYGGITGGWDIPGNNITTVNAIGDITLTGSQYAFIYSVQVKSGNEVITSWDYSTNGSTLPWGFDSAPKISNEFSGITCMYFDNNQTITMNSSLFEGYSNVQVVISAINYYNYYMYVNNGSGYNATDYLYVNGDSKPVTSYNSLQTLTWDISETPHTLTASPIGDVPIVIENYDSNNPVFIKSIKVLSSTVEILNWDAATNGTSFLSGMTNTSGTRRNTTDGNYLYYTGTGGTITLSSSLFAGYNSIQVLINAGVNDASYAGTIQVGGYYDNINTVQDKNYLWNINASILPMANDTYKPTKEGYTALVVAVKNSAKPAWEPRYYGGAFEYYSKDSLITYIENHIDSVKLLTDGMRIGDESDHSIGTVFNCSGTYNKFFFLGKGRARKKGAEVQSSMTAGGNSWPYYACEVGPFKYMFEQFSPTTGKVGDQIEDFYSEMMDGHVYKVVHDCGSVFQMGHQFSLTGNSGTGSFAFKGMHFFIPDYRLTYWVGTDSLEDSSTGVMSYFQKDGRDMNPLYDVDGNRVTSYPNTFYVNYAQYNPDYAPKVGLYLINLEATARPTAGYDITDPSTRFFDITLTWVSSLDEMTGHHVPQVFTIYYVDDNGDRHLLGTGEIPINVENPTNSLTLTYPWPQEATSQTFTYIVEGRGTGEYTPFVAWSNQDDVIIPGYDDFLALRQEHIESDFDIQNQLNWYRNFLVISNENALNGLTYSDVDGGPDHQMQFKLYRYVVDPAPADDVEPAGVEVATLTFKNATANTVDYEIEYSGQEIEPYTLKKKENGQIVNVPDAYELENLGIEDHGTLRVIGNGDLVIQPNGYNVNFLSITIKDANDNVLDSWTTADGDLTSPWTLSPGSMWVEHMTDQGFKTYYLEGGGYIYLPNYLNQHSGPLTVEIEAFGDGTTIARILVNDESHRFKNNEAETFTWTVNNNN